MLERFGRDHDARGMRRGVTNQAFQLARVLEQALVDRIFLRLGELGNHLDRLVEGHVQCWRHQLRQVIDLAQRDVECAANVTDDGSRLHGAEGDDLRHVVLSILLADVVDDTVAIAIVEVDVDVRHRDAFAVEEALEDQPMLDRIERGDAQRVRDDAARGGPAARTHCNTVLARKVDEVADDQEVGRVAHLLDDAELHLETIAHHLAQLRIA